MGKTKCRRTVHFKSRSSDRTYTAKRNEKGDISCNCFGWIYHRHCWHTDKLALMK